MATVTTITRYAFTDDSGDGETGDIWTAALIGTSLYDKIDLLFSAFGDHVWKAGGTGINRLWIENSTSGTANRAGHVLAAGTLTAQFSAQSQGYTTSAPFRASGLAVYSDGAGGIDVFAAAGPLYFGSNGVVRASFDTSGHFVPIADNSYNLGQTTGSNLRWKDILAVTKTSVLDVSWGSGQALVAVLEGPEYRLYDCGTVQLDATGQGTVVLGPRFREVTNTESVPYQAFAGGGRVMNKAPGGFTVRGQANDTVDWFVMAIRAGFENVRFRDPSLDREPAGQYDPWDARNRKDARNNTPTEPLRRTLEQLPNYTATRLIATKVEAVR